VKTFAVGRVMVLAALAAPGASTRTALAATAATAAPPAARRTDENISPPLGTANQDHAEVDLAPRITTESAFG
jgi:hypothetical protein